MFYPPGLYYVKKPKRFVILSFDKSSERNLSCFFGKIKPRRIEHLLNQEPFSSDPYFNSQFLNLNETLLAQWIWIVIYGHTLAGFGISLLPFNGKILSKTGKKQKKCVFVSFRPYVGQSEDHANKIEPHQWPLHQFILLTLEPIMKKY